MSGGMDHGHWHSGDSNDYGSDHEHVTSHENGHGAQGKEGSGNKKKGHGHGHSHEV
ncbi:unnamed protein product [Protopolystoma xenopodis]|uniref:Uncharacterized protein n=1 Tax=Protopolystoma xenopodis TaxID=117903 RepID=A0A3S5AN47_9PLAT|nr:unnamed protein product [Protopolystoma xenopodis]